MRSSESNHAMQPTENTAADRGRSADEDGATSAHEGGHTERACRSRTTRSPRPPEARRHDFRGSRGPSKWGPGYECGVARDLTACRGRVPSLGPLSALPGPRRRACSELPVSSQTGAPSFRRLEARRAATGRSGPVRRPGALRVWRWQRPALGSSHAVYSARRRGPTPQCTGKLRTHGGRDHLDGLRMSGPAAGRRRMPRPPRPAFESPVPSRADGRASAPGRLLRRDSQAPRLLPEAGHVAQLHVLVATDQIG